jgi:hypothetical protein
MPRTVAWMKEIAISHDMSVFSSFNTPWSDPLIMPNNKADRAYVNGRCARRVERVPRRVMHLSQNSITRHTAGSRHTP